jgi:hypothetical protein
LNVERLATAFSKLIAILVASKPFIVKNTLYVLLITGLFLACKSNTKQIIKDSITTSKQAVTDPAQSVIEKFKPFIQGVWVKKDYIDDVVKTRSPYKSFKYLEHVASMQISISKSNIDSVDVGYSLNNHEGANFTLYFKKGHKLTNLKVSLPDYDVEANFYELGYSVKGKDSCLILYHYSKNNHVLDSTLYERVSQTLPNEDDAGWGIQLLNNKNLIEGTYQLIDTTGHTLNIIFNTDGNVLGFQKFSKYYIGDDFVAGPENNLDQIYFDINNKTQKMYLFKLKADTLNLYESKEKPDSISLEYGKLKYKLVKQK